MNAPVVVQGTAVQVVSPAAPTATVPSGDAVGMTNESSSKTGCRDPIFAILFYCNIAAIIAVVALYSGAMTEDVDGNELETDYATYVRSTVVNSWLFWTLEPVSEPRPGLVLFCGRIIDD